MSQPDDPEQYWNGAPIPPRPPLPAQPLPSPPLPEQGPPAPPAAERPPTPPAAVPALPPRPPLPTFAPPVAESAPPAVAPSSPAVARPASPVAPAPERPAPPRPGFIGLPPGMGGGGPVASPGPAGPVNPGPATSTAPQTAPGEAPLDTVRAAESVGPAAPHPPAELPVTAPTTIESPVLHFPDGSSAVIGRGLLLGRDPVAQSAHPSAGLVRVHDVARSVSKTHALVTWEHGHVWVSDLHSTNGTAVVDDDGFETACTPEVPTPVPSGHSLLLGALRIVVQRVGR